MGAENMNYRETEQEIKHLVNMRTLSKPKVRELAHAIEHMKQFGIQQIEPKFLAQYMHTSSRVAGQKATRLIRRMHQTNPICDVIAQIKDDLFTIRPTGKTNSRYVFNLDSITAGKNKLFFLPKTNVGVLPHEAFFVKLK